MKRLLLLLSVAALLSVRGALAGQEHHHPDPEVKLGTVSFPISCMAPEQMKFERGVALLHSFWYEEAEKQFKQIEQDDPGCAMAYWGEAMSLYHALWNRPSESDLKRGWQLVQRAKAAGAKTDRERKYVEAAAAFYRNDNPEYEKRTVAWCQGMKKVYEQFPKDHEAAVFYALSLLASDSGDDPLENPRKAIAILNEIFQGEPNHPGVAHYLIHAADNPHLAELGLPAAQRYAQIAPASPHALHMPSHIFARLGLWQEDIASNLAAVAATHQPSAMHIGAEHQVHSWDFLVYAYLQIGEESKAQEIIGQLPSVRDADLDAGLGDYLNRMRAHFPALYALEMRQWKEAVALQPPVGVEPYNAAITYWARAIGAGHLRDAGAARDAVAHYDAMVEGTRKSPKPFLAKSMNLNRDSARAWLAFAEGRHDEAVGLLRSVADKQDATGKGEVDLPAREMLGDLLLEMGQSEEALMEYDKSMKTDPNRFNGLNGAARAAELAHHAETALRYYARLLKNCDDGARSTRPELVHAKDALAKN